MARSHAPVVSPDDHSSSLAASLVRARLRPPQVHLELVHRAALLTRLATTQASIVALSSPGGFGKTITLAQWSAADPRPFGWVQADDAMNDPLLFLQYLASALASVTDVDPRVEAWLRLTPPPVATRILPALAGGIRDGTPFVLVIDDAHVLADEACWQMLALIADSLPAGGQLCLAGRDEPRLPLGRLRAEGRLIEIGPADLALSRSETRELFSLQAGEASPAMAEAVWRTTEGWPVAVYLAALATRRGAAAGRVVGIRGHEHDIAQYLTSEVLDREKPPMRRFLLATSILERLSPGVCRAVTGDGNAGELLRGLSRRSLFVSALDDTDEWFRYHHLFAQFLQGELARGDEAVMRGLHARAAEWFEAHDDRDAAVRHWLAADAPKRAAAIVCRTHFDFDHGAPAGTIRRWLDLFRDDQIRADDALAVVAGFWGPVLGDTARGGTWAAAALRREPGDGLWPGMDVPVRAVHAILRALYAPDGVTRMRTDAEIAVALSQRADPRQHVAAVAMLGQACWFAGDWETAEALFRTAVEEGGAQVLAHLTSLAHQALTLADRGRWDEARTALAAAKRRFEEVGLSWEPNMLVLLLALTWLESHDGDPAAVPHITLIAQYLVGGMPPYLALLAEVVVGEILVERDELDEAARWLRSGLARLATYPDAGMLVPRLRHLRDTIEQRRLGVRLTDAERHVLELLPTQLTIKEIAEHLAVSPETVRTHVAALYGKLDAHVRTEAVARARELRLLAA